MKTRVTELLGIEYPIIQGGMAWVAEYHLAAAVSDKERCHKGCLDSPLASHWQTAFGFERL